MVTTIYAANLSGGTITTSGSTLVGCTSIGAANTTGNATTCTNFNNGTSYSSAGNVVADTFQGVTNTTLSTVNNMYLKDSTNTFFSAVDPGGPIEVTVGDLNIQTTVSAQTTSPSTGITINGPQKIFSSTSFSPANYVDVPISISEGESVDIRFYLFNSGTGQYLKIFAQTATSLTNPTQATVLASGGDYGTTTDRLCKFLLEDSTGQCFTITVTRDSSYTLIYMQGVFKLNVSSVLQQAFCRFTGYYSGSMTNLRLKLDTGNIYGFYSTNKYKA